MGVSVVSPGKFMIAGSCLAEKVKRWKREQRFWKFLRGFAPPGELLSLLAREKVTKEMRPIVCPCGVPSLWGLPASKETKTRFAQTSVICLLEISCVRRHSQGIGRKNPQQITNGRFAYSALNPRPGGSVSPHPNGS